LSMLLATSPKLMRRASLGGNSSRGRRRKGEMPAAAAARPGPRRVTRSVEGGLVGSPARATPLAGPSCVRGVPPASALWEGSGGVDGGRGNGEGGGNGRGGGE